MTVFVHDVARPFGLQDVHNDAVRSQNVHQFVHFRDMPSSGVFKPTDSNVFGVRFGRAGKAARLLEVGAKPAVDFVVVRLLMWKKGALVLEIRKSLKQALSATRILVVSLYDEANKHLRVLTLELSGRCRVTA